MPTKAIETIRAVKLDAQQKEILKLPGNALVIETERYTQAEDVSVEYTKNIIRNDYFIYTVELGAK
jgi:DNA-binding GntR family transcriptional regulator